MAKTSSTEPVYAIIDYEDKYVQPLILAAVKSRLPADVLVLVQSMTEVPSTKAKVLQWMQYEALDFERAMGQASSLFINSYVIRKALIRKHYLSTTVSHWNSKHPGSALSRHVTPGVEFELDFAEFLDDALVEAFELRESFEKNDSLDAAERQWWILKPGMSDRGQGIRLFSTEEELTSIFEEWDPPSDDEEEDEDATHSSDERDGSDEDKAESNGIMTSQLRHFIAQPYIHPPLLFSAPFSSAGRKFHIRTYVLAVGALKVYVYKPMLALFAGQTYSTPWKSESGDPNNELSGHLTNTCLQTGEREGSVHPFWSLPEHAAKLPREWKESVYGQICTVTGEVFEAAARGMMIHFQPLPNAFELFGLDFMVDEAGVAWLLEVNAFPDFAQTGSELNHLIEGLFEEVVDVAIKPFFGLEPEGNETQETGRMAKVLDIDLGRR